MVQGKKSKLAKAGQRSTVPCFASVQLLGHKRRTWSERRKRQEI